MDEKLPTKQVMLQQVSRFLWNELQSVYGIPAEHAALFRERILAKIRWAYIEKFTYISLHLMSNPGRRAFREWLDTYCHHARLQEAGKTQKERRQMRIQHGALLHHENAC